MGDPYCPLTGFTYSIHGLEPDPGVLFPRTPGTALKIQWSRLGASAFADYPLAEFFRGPVPVTAGSTTSELHFTRMAGCCNYPPSHDPVYAAWETYTGRWRFGAVVDDGGRVEYGEPPLLTMTGPRTDAPMATPADFTLRAADGGALADITWWYIAPQHNAFDGVYLDSVFNASPSLIVPAYRTSHRTGITDIVTCAGSATCSYQAGTAGALVARARLSSGLVFAARNTGKLAVIAAISLMCPNTALRGSTVICEIAATEGARFRIDSVVSFPQSGPEVHLRSQARVFSPGLTDTVRGELIVTTVISVWGEPLDGAGLRAPQELRVPIGLRKSAFRRGPER